ncbi:MAG: hypothetical protein CML04_02820 [Pseudozobellia sp.]|nr:hypothetical protein [Pseudozobellia sp.]MBG49074.1 hypothetical protein [Pseudozobellia sp.]|tara:strand:+ start:1605163 stop:1607973 length:2811 start_codon:yes stop_codon:yes gene_type:complete
MKERPQFGLLSLTIILLSLIIVACQKDEEQPTEEVILPDIALPEPPKRLTANTVTDSSAIVTWEKSSNHEKIANYVVYQDSIEVFRDTVTQYWAKSLKPETSYQFLVRTTDNTGNQSTFSEELLVVTKAMDSMPRDSVNLDSLNPYSVLLLTPKLKIDSIMPTSVQLSWNTDSNLSSVKEFKLFQDSTEVVALKETKYTVQGLLPENEYSYYVVAIDGQEKSTRPSNIVEIITKPQGAVVDTLPPPAPVGLRSTNTTSNSIDLSWNSMADSLQITAFRVYQDSILLGVVKDNLYQVKDLQPQNTYGFSVTAWDNEERESPFSEILRVTTLGEEVKDSISTLPLPPSNLRVTELGSESLSFEWSQPSDTLSVQEFRVFQDDVLIGSTPNTSFEVNSLSPKTTYSFTVSLVVEDGRESPKSENLSLTTEEENSSPEESAPPVPIGLSISNISSSSMELHWETTKDSAISGFKVYQDGLFKANTEKSPLNIIDLEAETTYRFSVTSIGDNEQESDQSVTVEATTLAEVTSPNDEEPPKAPSNLSSGQISENSITLTWEASSDNTTVTSYLVYQDGTNITSVTSTSYQVTNLEAGTEYGFQIRAIDEAENMSKPSTELRVSTQPAVVEDTTPPSVPQNLTATETATTTVDLSWGSSSDDTEVMGYYIYQDNEQIASTTTTSTKITGLTPSTTYRFEISAYDAKGNESGKSLGISVLTLQEEEPETDKVLIFTKTVEFRHSSIEKGVATFQALGQSNDFEVVQTENSEDFNTTNLAQYKVVVFLNTTGDVLNNTQQTAFENYIRSGGSFMGVHAASDTEYDWSWYGQLVGAYSNGHPNIQEANLEVVNSSHSSTAHLPSIWTRTEEWYNFKDIYSGINPLIMLDESSYQGGTNGNYHPFSWYQAYDGGRVFYTAGGHSNSAYDEPDFRQHLLGGLFYCLER